MRTLKVIAASAGLASVLVLSGCQSRGNGGPIPQSYLSGTVLDRNEIQLSEATRYLEVQLNPLDSHLRLNERARIEGFVEAYKAEGHGPLVMSLPQNHANEELAVKAVAEAREIAWAAGVDYTEISGSAFEADGRNAPMVLGYRAYAAVAPDCPSKAVYNFADATTNNDLPSLGCSVRTNMAAMIARPGDLLGNRPQDPSDLARRQVQLELYRVGETTAASRGEEESGAVSTAVN